MQPRRRDLYKSRVRVHVRMDPESYEQLQEFASSFHMSVSHFMDLLATIAMDEGGEWLRECLDKRVEEGLVRVRAKYWPES